MTSGGVSVIIPTRDRPELAEAAVRSVLLQTRPVEQIVLVDDGTVPGLAGKLEAVRALAPTVELVRRPVARGPAAARNVGLDHARGDFLLFLDDDDLIHPRFVEDGLARLAACPSADILVFLYECIFTPSSLDASYPVALLFDYAHLASHPLRLADTGNAVPRSILEQRPVSAFLRYLIPVQSCLVRRAAIGELRFPETLRQGEDTYFWIALAAAGRRFMLDERVYAFVRRHAGNTTRSWERYMVEIQACYERLLADDLLPAPDDVFLAHLKLLWFKSRTRQPGRWSHVAHVAGSPTLLAREVGFWAANLRARRKLLQYYLAR